MDLFSKVVNISHTLKLLLKGLTMLAWGVKHLLGVPPRGTTETSARLSWVVEKQPRYTQGRFRFPFGLIQYVDGLSLQSQYLEIFVRRGYNFRAECDDPVIIDCGGNVGLSAIRFKQQYPTSCVTVFEADPMISDVLCANLRSLGHGDVQVVRAAAWIKTGRVSFSSDGADSGMIDEEQGQQIVDAVRLADFITEPIDLLKLDIEGAEYAVIQDLYEAGKINLVKRLICEIHGRHSNKEVLWSLLKTLTDQGFSFTFTDARCAPDLIGDPEPTPFTASSDGKFLLHLYSWQEV